MPLRAAAGKRIRSFSVVTRSAFRAAALVAQVSQFICAKRMMVREIDGGNNIGTNGTQAVMEFRRAGNARKCKDPATVKLDTVARHNSGSQNRNRGRKICQKWRIAIANQG